MNLQFFFLSLVSIVLSGCMTNSGNSCAQECVKTSTGYGELKACEDRCSNPNAIVDPKSKNIDRTPRN